MVRTVLDKLGSDLRVQLAYVLLAFAVSLVAELLTGRLGMAGLVLSVSALVLAGINHRHERVSLHR